MERLTRGVTWPNLDVVKTYPHLRADGTVAYFEVSNLFPWSLGFMRRLLSSVDGVTDFKRQRFNDNRFSFVYRGRPCVVNEPFGDNSRYWIGPTEKDPPLDMRLIQEAFAGFGRSFMFRRSLGR